MFEIIVIIVIAIFLDGQRVKWLARKKHKEWYAPMVQKWVNEHHAAGKRIPDWLKKDAEEFL